MENCVNRYAAAPYNYAHNLLKKPGLFGLNVLRDKITKAPMKFLALFMLFAIPNALAVVVDLQWQKQAVERAVLDADVLIEEVEAISDSQFHALRWSRARIEKIYAFQDDGFQMPALNDTILIETPGAELGGVGSFYPGFPRPLRGQRYRVKLSRHSNAKFFVVGFDVGFIPKNPTRSYTRNRTDGSNGEGTGAFLYWDKSFFPIPYFISAPTFTDHPSFINAIDASFTTWSEPSDLYIRFLAMGCSNATRHENDGLNNVILLKDFWPYDPAAVAITRNFYVASEGDKSGMILDSDILLNGVYHAFSASGESGRHDIQNIVTHEAGHFLGLGHEISPEDSDATMYGSAETGETKKRTLADNDLTGIRIGYTGSGPVTNATGTHCQLIDTPRGCNAVHGSQSPTIGIGLMLFLPLLLLLGPRFLDIH